MNKSLKLSKNFSRNIKKFVEKHVELEDSGYTREEAIIFFSNIALTFTKSPDSVRRYF
jgi:hypothetical protein